MPNFLADRPISPLIEAHLARPNTKTTQNGPFIFGLFVSAAFMVALMVTSWPNHVGEVLGVSWFRMAFLTSITIPGMISLTFLFFATFLSKGLRRVGF